MPNDDYILRSDAKEALTALPADLDAETVQRCIEAMNNPKAADVEPKQRWIPVTERPPEEPGEYIVAYHPCHWDVVGPSVKVGIDTFRGKTAWAKNKYQRVIAWQEKPEPPKEGKNENAGL